MIASLYDTFKHWSDGKSVWLLSDLHLGDEDTHNMNPSWISPEEQINIINNKICKHDTLILLGDHGNPKYIEQLKTENIISIYGNHDKPNLYKGLFKEVYSGALFIAPQILLSHEPIYGLKFCTNIHGHEHNGTYDYTDREGCRHLNIAADVIDYQPVNLGKLIKAGLVAGLPTIHRLTIDRAIENPIHF